MYRFRKNKLSIVGLIIVFAMCFMALFADFIAPYPEDAKGATNFPKKFQPPSLEHPFGTDAAGRDILSRVIFGSRISLISAVTVQIMVVTIGLLTGTIAAYVGGWVNAIIMRIADIFLIIPPLALAMVAIATFEPSMEIAILAVALAWWPWYTRLVQGEVLSIKQELFVESSRAMGKSSLRLIYEDILPNLRSVILVKATLDIGFIVIFTSSLSFLGLGARPPTPAWGTMISIGRKFLPDIWWPSTFPGLFIFITVLGFILLGDGLRDVFDVKIS